jgi:hypothetical protein
MNQLPSSPETTRSETSDILKRIVQYLEMVANWNSPSRVSAEASAVPCSRTARKARPGFKPGSN